MQSRYMSIQENTLGYGKTINHLILVININCIFFKLIRIHILCENPKSIKLFFKLIKLIFYLNLNISFR